MLKTLVAAIAVLSFVVSADSAVRLNQSCCKPACCAKCNTSCCQNGCCKKGCGSCEKCQNGGCATCCGSKCGGKG